MSDYPNRRIRIIVPGSKGGPGSIIANAVATKLSDALLQPVDLEFAKSQSAGLNAIATAPPDGYTIGMGGSSFYITSALYKNLPFNASKDFAPVALAATIANVLVVHPSVPVHSVPELIAYAKANPGALRYGSSGNDEPPRVAGELFKKMAGVNIVHVPYKGHVLAGDALCEGKELQLMFDSVPTALRHLKTGELRGLAVTTARRLSILPDMPTIAESGLPGFEINPAMGILAPSATPRRIRETLAEEIRKIMAQTEIKTHLHAIGIEATSTTYEYFASFMAQQLETWPRILEMAGIEQLDAPASP